MKVLISSCLMVAFLGCAGMNRKAPEKEFESALEQLLVTQTLSTLDFLYSTLMCVEKKAIAEARARTAAELLNALAFAEANMYMFPASLASIETNVFFLRARNWRSGISAVVLSQAEEFRKASGSEQLQPITASIIPLAEASVHREQFASLAVRQNLGQMRILFHLLKELETDPDLAERTLAIFLSGEINIANGYTAMSPSAAKAIKQDTAYVNAVQWKRRSGR